MTWVSKALMRAAKSWPILPSPITPTVLPWISTPEYLERAHSPRRRLASAAGMWRAVASSSARACSAAETMFEVGAFTTITPARRGRGDVDVVEPHPGAPDDREPPLRGEDLRVDLRGAAHEQRVGVAHGLEQRGPVGAVDVPDLDLVAEHLQRRRGELLGHQDDGLRHAAPRVGGGADGESSCP